MQLARLLLCAALAAALPCAAAPADAAGRAELAAIDKLSESSTPQALRRLEALKARLGSDASYELRRDVLRAEVWLREDAGQLEQSYAADREALQLALANKDQDTVLLSSFATVRQLLDQNRNDEAAAALAAIQARLPAARSHQLAIAADVVQGDVFNAQARYDKALAAYLSALKREHATPEAAESRANLGIRIAQIHINADNPAQAVATARRALQEKPLPLRASARLQSTLGIALVKLGRGEEALAAFRSALGAAEQGSMTGLEAATRGNLADFYLRQHDYVRAAEEARLALAASEQVKDQNLIIMAKANLGFALMGQGRMAEGAPWVDAVIAQMRDAEANAELDALLDEKGRMQEQHGLFKDALATVREQQAVQQSGARKARDQAIARLQEEYEAAARTRQIDLLRRENQLKDADLQNRRLVQLLTSLAAVLTVVGGAVVLVLYRRAARSNAQLQQLNTQLEYHSMRDALTGLHNRRSFTEKMKARAQRSESERRHDAQAGVDCLALMDIDHFKHINDRWGHAVGDAVLVEVARRLGAAVRDTDLVLRWGGEEFLIFAAGADPSHIEQLIGRVLDGIGSTPVDTGSGKVPVTMSAGVVWLPFPGVPSSTLEWESGLRLADWALYQCKAHGRNQARIVTGLHGPLDTVLAALDGAAAAAAGQLVDTACVAGPPQAPSL